MRDIQKKGLPHPLAPLLKPLRMARRTEAAGATGEYDEPLLPTVRTPDAGKPTAWIAAVEIALDHLLDNGPEEAVLLLKAALIFGQEPVEVVEEDAVKDGAFWMPGDSWQSRKGYPENRPERSVGSFCLGNGQP